MANGPEESPASQGGSGSVGCCRWLAGGVHLGFYNQVDTARDRSARWAAEQLSVLSDDDAQGWAPSPSGPPEKTTPGERGEGRTHRRAYPRRSRLQRPFRTAFRADVWLRRGGVDRLQVGRVPDQALARAQRHV